MENGKINLKGKLAAVANQRAKERDYWLNRLAGEWQKGRFPYDYDDVKKTDTPRAGRETLSFRFGEELFPALLRMSGGNDYAVHTIAVSGLTALLARYTGSGDIVLGTTIYRQDFKGEIINRLLILRNAPDPAVTFRELLLQVKETIDRAVENQNYPVEILAEQLNRPISLQENFPLFDVSLILENIHDKAYLLHIRHSMAFTLTRKEHSLEGEVQYNPSYYRKGTVAQIVSHFTRLMQTVLANADIPLNRIEILSGEEKKLLIDDFNDTRGEYPGHKTIHRWFEEQVEKTPDKIAVCAPLDLSDIYDQLESETVNPAMDERMGTCCFKKNPYIYRTQLELPGKNSGLNILKTNRHNSVIIDNNTVKLLDLFDGKRNLKSIYSFLNRGGNVEFLLYSMSWNDLLEVTFQFNPEAEVFSIAGEGFADFIRLVQTLYGNHLIELTRIHPGSVVFKDSISFDAVEGEGEIVLEDILIKDKTITKADVLLLGDTPGTPTVGLLYLGAYLRRKGIKTYCRFYDPSRDYASMKRNTRELLEKIQPKVVAVSMKWFLYIARVIDMCAIIKEYAAENSLDITVVVGGNTASYYWQEFIGRDCIDYLVRGDGEGPLLKICRGEDIEGIPNCVYKKNGEIVENPVAYIQDETAASGIYLSHLDEILLSRHASYFGAFFIYTHKGCAMNCLYCGGCNSAQQRTFNRKNVHKRGAAEVRKDILAAKKYTSTFQFEFDIPDKNLPDYCKKIWAGIHLANHFCIFSTLTPPSAQLIELVSTTFKYIYWDFDICTPAERHREQLVSLGLVKPQPSDDEILDFMARCEKYANIEVRLNLITGLPYFTLEDTGPGEQLLAKIMNNYSCFGELHWARLHAQPGAPIITNAEKHHMDSYAVTFEDFLKYSRKNFNREAGYSSVENFDYPYIYFKNHRLNSRVTKFYLDNTQKVYQRRRDKKRGLAASETLTYRQLNEKAADLAGVLRTRGVGPGEIAGIRLGRSLEIPLAILAVLKTGAAYMPIDPEFPAGRVDYMLKDSNAKILLSGESKVIESSGRQGRMGMSKPAACYVIYTSGTTGKPKGVLLSHENLVNYVHWFTTAAGLTAEDKTVQTSSFAFDLGYTSLYTSLLNGGELHILPREIYLLAERSMDYIKRKGITYIKVTPSLFSVMVDAPNFSRETCKSLRVAAIGGEAINVKDIEKAHSICGHIQIMNHYGPTEATIGCIATFIDFHRFEEYKKRPVIGKPINNTEIYILGKDLNLLPVGVPGELCISGAGLAGGYLNRPELTSDRFCLNNQKLLWGVPGGFSPRFLEKSPPARRRHYKTGDLARWLSDGNIEFLGRIDQQVKVKGYRIELGEIENRLISHDAVKDAVVTVKENGDKYICAYIVPGEKKSKEIETAAVDGALLFIDHFAQTVKKNRDREAVTSNGRTLTYGSLDKYAGPIAREILENYDDGYSLSKAERVRYKRQMLLHGWGIEGQEKLKGTTVFVAGAGGGGSPTIMQLALLGFGTIRVCDFDEIELSNLNRQFLHDEERLGMNKAISAKIAVNRVNSNIEVIPITGKLTADNVFELVGDSALIFDMFDGPADKFILSQCAVVKRIPHIIIAMTDLNAYAAVCHTPHTPCYHCIFDKNKLESIVAGMRNYDESYSKNPLAVAATSLFVSTGTAINEALKILLELDRPAYNKFFYFNQRGASGDFNYTASYRSMTHLFSDYFRKICREQGFDWESGWRGNLIEVLDIKADPDCPVCGARGAGKRKALEEQMKKLKKEERVNKRSTQKNAALLLDPGIEMAAGLIGSARSGKTCVPFDPSSTMNKLADMLEDCGSRIILTDENHLNLAEELRDKVNKNIKVININHPDEPGDTRENVTVEIHREQPAYMLYPPGPGQNGDFNRSVTELYRALVKGNGPYIYEPGGSGALASELTAYLREELPDYMIPAYFVPLDNIPLTANGKVNKKALPDPQTQRKEDTYTAPSNPVEKKLAKIWSEVLGVKRIGIDHNFFQVGLDSIKALQASARMSKEGLKAEMRDIFSNPTIRQLSKYITHIDGPANRAVVAGSVKLTPIQRWFFENYPVENHHFNMAVMLYREEGFAGEFLEKAFQMIVRHHDALRMVYKFHKDEIIQEIKKPTDNMFHLEIIRVEKDENVKELIERRADRIQGEIDLETGPLVRLALFKTSKGDHLLIVIHHLVTDGYSWRILFEDLETLFQQYEKGEQPVLPPKTGSVKDWAEKLCRYADSDSFLEERAFWTEMESLASRIPRLPVDFAGESYVKDNDTLSFGLNEEETRRLLTETDRAFGTKINDMLLTALGLAVRKIYGHRYLLIAMEGHGREPILEDIAVGRTVGFFTSQYPVLLDISYDNDLSRQIITTKETLHQIPAKGIGYGILKYLTAKEHKEGIDFKLKPQVNFNYLGQFDSEVERMASFKISHMPVGGMQSMNMKRPYHLEISGMMADKRLTMSAVFAKTQYKRETVKRIMDCYKEELKGLISFCRSREEAEVTPSDFTFKGLSIDQLDGLFQ